MNKEPYTPAIFEQHSVFIIQRRISTHCIYNLILTKISTSYDLAGNRKEIRKIDRALSPNNSQYLAYYYELSGFLKERKVSEFTIKGLRKGLELNRKVLFYQNRKDHRIDQVIDEGW